MEASSALQLCTTIVHYNWSGYWTAITDMEIYLSYLKGMTMNHSSQYQQITNQLAHDSLKSSITIEIEYTEPYQQTTKKGYSQLSRKLSKLLIWSIIR